MSNLSSIFYPSPAASGGLSHKGRGDSSSTTSFFCSTVRTHLSPCGRGRPEGEGEGGLSKIQVILSIFLSLGIHGVMASFLLPSFQKVSEKELVSVAVEWERVPQVISEEMVNLQPTSSSRAPGGGVAIRKLDWDVPNAPRNEGGMVRKPSSPALIKGTAIKKVAKRLDCNIASTSPNDEEVRGASLISHLSTKTPSSQSSQKKTYQPLPKYPWICRKRGQTGLVCLAIQTNGEGHVVRVSLHKSSGHSSLDQAAINALKTWVLAGGPHQKLFSIAFRLKGK